MDPFTRSLSSSDVKGIINKKIIKKNENDGHLHGDDSSCYLKDDMASVMWLSV